MAVKHLPWAYDLDWHFDSASQHHLFLMLVYYADRKKAIVRVNQTELAQRTFLSRATVAREIGRLQEIGLLQRLGHGRYGIKFRDEREEVEAKRGQEGLSGRACEACGEPVASGDSAVAFSPSGQPHIWHQGHYPYSTPDNDGQL